MGERAAAGEQRLKTRKQLLKPLRLVRIFLPPHCSSDILVPKVRYFSTKLYVSKLYLLTHGNLFYVLHHAMQVSSRLLQRLARPSLHAARTAERGV